MFNVEDILKERFDIDPSLLVSDDISGLIQKPKLCNFANCVEGIRMLERHVRNPSKSRIAIHCDVDMDGIGSGYMLWTFLNCLGIRRKLGCLINSEKEHGLSEYYVNLIGEKDIELLIVLDSGSNDLEYIRKMQCDVLVIDHHDILHNELIGETAGGEYIIVSNMVKNEKTDMLQAALEYAGYVIGDKRKISRNDGLMEIESCETEPYIVDERMSCGLVLYEFLRVYQLLCKTGGILEDKMLYQWVGVTLLTDAIKLSNERNQYYMTKTVHCMDVETCLKEMLKSVSSYKQYLDKVVINYSIAPRVNKAIRAGASKEALAIVLESPQRLMELDKYKGKQETAIDTALKNRIYGLDADGEHKFALIILDGTGISKSYTGVIATKLVSNYHVNSAVCLYNPITGKYEGSFRGRKEHAKYRTFFEKNVQGIYAQGHQQAFGFKASPNELKFLLYNINKAESKDNCDREYYLTAGVMPESSKGVYHIDDMTTFKKQQGLLKIGLANSKLATEETIKIVTKRPQDEVVYWNERRTVGKYSVLGLECKAFEEIVTDTIAIEVEYNRELEVFVRNLQN